MAVCASHRNHCITWKIKLLKLQSQVSPSAQSHQQRKSVNKENHTLFSTSLTPKLQVWASPVYNLYKHGPVAALVLVVMTYSAHLSRNWRPCAWNKAAHAFILCLTWFWLNSSEKKRLTESVIPLGESRPDSLSLSLEQEAAGSHSLTYAILQQGGPTSSWRINSCFPHKVSQ